jgi:hypothetical protein
VKFIDRLPKIVAVTRSEAGAETLKDRDLAGREIGGMAGYGVCFEFTTRALDAMIYDLGESLFHGAFLQIRKSLRMKVELAVNGERRPTGMLAQVTFISQILIQINYIQ